MSSSSEEDLLIEPCELVDNNHLQVYLRIKPDLENYNTLYEVRDSNTLISKIPEGSNVVRNVKYGDLVTRKYRFSKIFGPEVNQNDLFNELIKPKLLKFLDGTNSTFMTYGISNSGKTYTIIGTQQDPGVLPRSIEYIFKKLPNLSKLPNIKPLPNGETLILTKEEINEEIKIKQSILDFIHSKIDYTKHIETYCFMQSLLSEDEFTLDLENSSDFLTSIWISFVEIYKEHIYDLLKIDKSDKNRNKLKLGNSNGHTYIKNVTYINVSSGLEAYQILQYGLHRLNFAKTEINHHSSRSHSIFTLILVQEKNDQYCVSRFNFCDLAGAERSKRTRNVGERLKESNNINTSLLVLGRCIQGIRNNQKGNEQIMIPFRESKLTQIFQRALSGFEEICIIVNINPCRKFFDETQNVLNFSAIAKEIIVICQPNNSFKKNGLLSEIIPVEKNKIISDEDKILITEDLKKKYSELISLFEENAMKSKRLTRCRNMEREQFEISVKNNIKNLFKGSKLEYLLSIKENLGFSSDSSDEELFIEDNLISEKHKNISDIETIPISSSENEEETHLLKEKIVSQEKLIDEHHKTISVLEIELTKLKSKYGKNIEMLERQIYEQEIKIKELNKRLDENEKRNEKNRSFSNFTKF